MGDHITSAGAGMAISSPFWLPSLQPVSEIAAALLPILGCIWLAVQIATRLLARKQRKR